MLNKLISEFGRQFEEIINFEKTNLKSKYDKNDWNYQENIKFDGKKKLELN